MSLPPIFSGSRDARSFVFCVVFALFLLAIMLSILFDVQLLITPLVFLSCSNNNNVIYNIVSGTLFWNYQVRLKTRKLEKQTMYTS